MRKKEKKGGGEGRARATNASGAQQVEDAPVHHLGPTFFGLVWHLTGSNGSNASNASNGSNGNEREREREEEERKGEEGRRQQKRQGRKAKVRAGRRKRPRQDVGSCLPAGG